jgi:predicted MFS family arabinose efflux permease
LGLFGLAASRQPWQVVAASWLLIGPAGALTFYEPAFVALDQWFTGPWRAKAIGILAVVGGLAGPIYLPLSGWLIGAVGWRSTAVIIGAALVTYGLIVSWFFIPAGSSQLVSAPLERGGTSRLLRDQRFVWYSASVIVSYGALQAIFFHRIAVFEAAGFAVGGVTAWAALSGLLGFPGRYGAPVLATRVRPTTVSAAALGALAAAAGLMVSPTRFGMVAHFVIFGLAFGTLLPLRPVIMSDWYSGVGYGRIMGTQWSAAAVGGALGPWLAGIGRDAAGSYELPMAVVAVAMASSAVFTLLAARAAAPEAP